MENQPPLQIGLLLCDDVIESARARYGDYARMFRRGLRAGGNDAELTAFNCYLGEFPRAPEEFDAYLISGSRNGAYEKLDWISQLCEFVRGCYAQRKKTVGICFGHQLIAHALGGEARKAEAGWGAGIHASRIIARAAWMEDDSDSAQYNLVVLHQDQVVSLPPGFRVLAANDFCPVSMFEDEVHGAALGIQGHPEFDKAYCAFRIDARKELFGPALHRASLDSLEKMELDSARVWRWVASFLRH
ncbi:MAG: gamma-glutamyl-gamma-aminobutyrate hydrolase family protein [Gammaproteobacteria bacterium]|nr:gamma-glutamyl-gamma-aminobutyrate hydrolase family protein [Gammaproteobacteria bacterium]